MLGTDFCAWVQTWLGICVGALGRPTLAGETGQLQIAFAMGYVQFSSVAQSCLILCNPIDCSMPGLPVLHQCLRLVQTHVHWVGDAIQPSHPVVFFSSCLQSFPVIGSFLMSMFFTSVGLITCLSNWGWLKYWSFNFSIGPSNKYSRSISFSINWLDLLVVQWILKSLVQYHSSKPSILHHSPFFMVQLSHLYMTTRKIIALIILKFFSKVMSLLLKIFSRFVIDFLQTSKHLLISWLQSSSAVIFEPAKNKVSHCFHCFSIYLLWSDGTKCHDLHFLNVEFKPDVSLSSFTFIKWLLVPLHFLP